MTTVPVHLRHNGRDFTLQYVHSSETDAIADRERRDTPAIVHPLDLDQRFYGVYTASAIEKHSTAAVDLADYDAGDSYLIDSVLSIFDVIDDEQDLVWYKPLEPERIADALVGSNGDNPSRSLAVNCSRISSLHTGSRTPTIGRRSGF